MNVDSKLFFLNNGQSAQIYVQIAAEIDESKAGKTQGSRVEIASDSIT